MGTVMPGMAGKPSTPSTLTTEADKGLMVNVCGRVTGGWNIISFSFPPLYNIVVPAFPSGCVYEVACG